MDAKQINHSKSNTTRLKDEEVQQEQETVEGIKMDPVFIDEESMFNMQEEEMIQWTLEQSRSDAAGVRGQEAEMLKGTVGRFNNNNDKQLRQDFRVPFSQEEDDEMLRIAMEMLMLHSKKK